MVTSSARRAVTTLVVLAGMVVGAAPIYAQDVTPPDDTSSSTGRVTYVAPTTTTPARDVTAPTTTTVPPRVQAPSTTIPAIPTPPSLPPETPKDVKNPCEEDPELCEIPPIPTFPPQEAPAPPSLPDDLPPDQICQKHPEACDPPDDTPPTTAPDDEAPALPGTPSDFAANDAGAVRDGQRIYRQVKLRESAETGMSCATWACVDEIRQLCSEQDQNASWVEQEDGGWEVFCWEGLLSTPAVIALVALAERHGAELELDITATPATSGDPAPGPDDDGDGVPDNCEQIRVSKVCLEIDDVLECWEHTELYCWEDDGEGEGETPAPKPGRGDVSADESQANEGDAGMTCATADCMMDFVAWCLDTGGQSATDPTEDFSGWEMNCQWPEGDIVELTVLASSANQSQANEGDGELVCEEKEVLACTVPAAGEIQCEWTVDVVCSEDGGGSSENEAPAPGGSYLPAELNCDDPNHREDPCVDESDPQQSAGAASLGIAAPGSGPQADAGMTCPGGSLDCGAFLNWCDEVGGESQSESVGDGYHEITCHLSDGEGGESAENHSGGPALGFAAPPASAAGAAPAASAAGRALAFRS